MKKRSNNNDQRRGRFNLPYRNYIPCGKLTCRTLCDHNSLNCILCKKYFHYGCQNLKKRDYQNIINNNLDYICDGDCYSSILPFFETERKYFLDTIIDHDGLYPCRKCKVECLDDCIQCEICDSWLHFECADLEFDSSCYVQNLCGFICSRKCYSGELPFSSSKFVENDKLSPFEDFYPCKICQIDCVNNCVQCDKCSIWVHYHCADLSESEIEYVNIPENEFFCSERCKAAPLDCRLI